MKTKKPMRPLLAAFVLLVGITSTDAALCSATAFAATVSTCDCPVGTGPSGSYGSALPAGTYGGAETGATDANKASQLGKANDALALCTDLHPGYKKSTDTVLPTACVIGDGYCPGMVDVFKTDSTQIIVTTGFDGAYTTPVTGSFVTKTGAGALEFLQKTIPIDCPANSGGVNTAATASAAGASSTGQTAPFTLDKCKVTDGFYVKVVVGTLAGEIAECPVAKVCSTGTTAASPVHTPVNCVTSAGVNDDLTPGGFFCPVKTYGALGATLALSLSGITGEKPCGAGSGPLGAAATTCDVLPGFYGANSATGAAMTACPVGITGNGGATFKLACTEVAPGYEILTDIPAQITPGAITALTAGITPCAGVNKVCLGTRAIAFTGLTESLATYTAVAKSAASSSCPLGTGNELTGAAAQGVNAGSYKAACLDLLVGHTFKKTGVSATITIADLVIACAKGDYRCAGSAGLFVNYDEELNGSKVYTLATTLGLTVANKAAVKDGTDFLGTIAAATTGSVIRAECPANTNNVKLAANGPRSSCVTDLGYYVDHQSLATATLCPVGKYCPGGFALDTAGGALSCPAGSTGPTNDPATVSGNSHIDDCTVNNGFYIATGAVNVPVPCLTANICAGGGPVGTAGGSVACPTDSTNVACVAGAGGSSTTVNSPITVAAASPDVTVTPTVAAAVAPDVTVTNTVPSASSASTTVASMVLMAVSAFVVAF